MDLDPKLRHKVPSSNGHHGVGRPVRRFPRPGILELRPGLPQPSVDELPFISKPNIRHNLRSKRSPHSPRRWERLLLCSRSRLREYEHVFAGWPIRQPQHLLRSSQTLCPVEVLLLSGIRPLALALLYGGISSFGNIRDDEPGLTENI